MVPVPDWGPFFSETGGRGGAGRRERRLSVDISPRGVARALAVLLCLVPLQGPASAQTPPPASTPPTFELPEIDIAGRRPQLPATTPASISIITAKEIAATG